jgi:CelD/BcsL family acetyltransferase involved in cellulose biosynthesis
VRISVIRPGDLGTEDIDRWRAMQRSTSALANPFLSPEFTIAAGRFRPRARVAVLTDGAATVGFFPFERGRLGLGTPIAAGLTDAQGLVHAPGAEWDGRELLRACHVSVWKFDHLVGGQRSFDKYRLEQRPSPVIDLGGGFEAYYRGLTAGNSQLGKNVPRRARKLGREVGELRFVLADTDAGLLRTLMAWKSAQYRRTNQPDLFAQPWIAGLLEALFSTDGNHMRGLLSVLYAGDVPVAAHFGIRCGQVLAHWFPAYDTNFSRYSPGLILHLQLAEGAAADGVGLIDLGTGAKRYKDELKTGDLFVSEGVVTTHSPLAGVHVARSAASRWAVQAIRQHATSLEAAKRMRAGYRRTRTVLARASGECSPSED